jgi:hypothetical protein
MTMTIPEKVDQIIAQAVEMGAAGVRCQDCLEEEPIDYLSATIRSQETIDGAEAERQRIHRLVEHAIFDHTSRRGIDAIIVRHVASPWPLAYDVGLLPQTEAEERYRRETYGIEAI